VDCLVLPVVGDDDPHEESEADHGAEKDVQMDVDGVGRTHLRHNHITQVNPS
jgi:hypothetical protein